MLLTSKKIKKELKEKNYTIVPFPINEKKILESVQAFFKFLEEPTATKKSINFTISPNHRRGAVGYKIRDGQGDIYDDKKEFFHFHPAIFREYSDLLKKNDILRDFVLKALPIWEEAHQTLQNIFKVLEEEFPGAVKKIFKPGKDSHILLRFLNYNWKSSGECLAKPHFDAGSATLAIAESCPGLRIGSCPESLKFVDHKKEEAIFMLSSNYKNVLDTEELLPGWHDVVQMNKACIGKPYARWAVVVFVEAYGVKALSRRETHKWYGV